MPDMGGQMEQQERNQNEGNNLNPNEGWNVNQNPQIPYGYQQPYMAYGQPEQNPNGYVRNQIVSVYPPDYGMVYLGEGMEPQAPTTRILSKVAFSLFLMGIAVLLSQQLIGTAVNEFWPWIAETDWYLWALTAISMIGIGLPVFFFLTRRIPEPKHEEVKKLKPMQFIVIFFICTSVMYITNFFSVFLTFLIALLKGGSFLDLNPLTDVMIDSNLIFRVLYAALAAPIIEEIIFRKLLLNKLRRYGDIPAILLSAIAFGLFHMNVAQMFYATALGIIFAYVAIRTNSIRYNILLHILVNSMGVVIAPFATKQNVVFSMILVAWVFTCITLGLVLLILNIKKIRLYRIQKPLEKKSGYLLNLGTILYTIMCLTMVVVQILA